MSAPRSHRSALVEVEGLTKHYPARRSWLGRPAGRAVLALDALDLELGEGEILGLVGPNGAGKTTLIKLLSTLLYPSAGRVAIGGLDLVADAAAVRRIVALVGNDERSFYWRLTGRQNLRFFATLNEVPAGDAERRIDELIELVDLRDKADERFDSYSAGMKQRLAFARGLLTRPRLLLLDEPTKGVDPLSREEMLRLLRERILERWHPTVLITSQDLGEIEQVCERIAFLSAGRLLALGSMEELRALTRPFERFELEVRGLSEERLRAAASAAEAARILAFSCHNGTSALALEFPRGSPGFARFVRGVIEGGGDLAACTNRPASLTDVFHELLAKRGAEPAKTGSEEPT